MWQSKINALREKAHTCLCSFNTFAQLELFMIFDSSIFCNGKIETANKAQQTTIIIIDATNARFPISEYNKYKSKEWEKKKWSWNRKILNFITWQAILISYNLQMHLAESISNVEWRVIGAHTKQLHIHTQIALTPVGLWLWSQLIFQIHTNPIIFHPLSYLAASLSVNCMNA